MYSKEVVIGDVAVDSGQLMICDPCYLKEYEANEFRPNESVKEGDFSYHAVCHLTTGSTPHGQLCFRHGHPGFAVAFSSGYGDGLYPVYATIEDGRVMEVRIVMR
jgi:hypothetical protein